mgnify:CR=1 FL=1
MSDTDRRDRMTYTLPEAAIRAAGHALRTRAGVDFDAVEAARDMTASHRQARAVDLTEPKEDRR